MCYTGKCPYETYDGECGLGFTKFNKRKNHILTYITPPPCEGEPEYILEHKRRRKEETMKILNKNKKLKHSKMFLDLGVCDKICKKYNQTAEGHMKVMEESTKVEDYAYTHEDISIILEIYERITKVIHRGD